MLVKLAIGLIVILIGAELFTNGIEWLGAKLNLSEGAVGSILAAVGTALPESIIPIVAILFSKDVESSHIGIGAILGAPFMLGTLAFFVTGLSARICFWRGNGVKYLNVNTKVILQDLLFFILMYSLAIGSSLFSQNIVHKITAFILVLAYVLYVYKTLKSGENILVNDLKPLYFYFWKKPGLIHVLIQVFFALGAIIYGANYFVEGIKIMSLKMKISPLVTALIIAPIATELPEKFNSIIWIASRKDTLALGNITGAMVFQSSIIPAFGMLFTPWQLNSTALLSGILVLFSTLLVITGIVKKRKLSTSLLTFSGIFYLFFISAVLWGISNYGS